MRGAAWWVAQVLLPRSRMNTLTTRRVSLWMEARAKLVQRLRSTLKRLGGLETRGFPQ